MISDYFRDLATRVTNDVVSMVVLMVIGMLVILIINIWADWEYCRRSF